MENFRNIMWNVFGGFASAIAFFIMGAILCVTIVGIPMGLQFFKLGKANLSPFEKEFDTDFEEHPVLNIIWLLLFGIELVAFRMLLGCILCVTIVGIPFAKQQFKLLKLSAAPFGADITE